MKAIGIKIVELQPMRAMLNLKKMNNHAENKRFIIY